MREVDSDEDKDEDDNEDEVDAMDVDDEEEEDDVDAEGSEEDDMDAEGDEDEEESVIVPTNKATSAASKPKISVTKAQDTVEAKEMVMSDDDEELSDPDSDLDDMEDAEGEDDDAEGDDDDEEIAGPEGDIDMDSDEDMSRDQTPDMSKLTRRQRAVLEQEEDGSLLALSNEAQKKKHLTAEEHQMRRAEMARRRKNLSEKRNEEEKVCFFTPQLAPYRMLKILSLTPSIASSRSSLQSAVARALLLPRLVNLAKRRNQSRNVPTHYTCDTSRTSRARNLQFQTSGYRLLWVMYSRTRRSRQAKHRGVAKWSRRLHRLQFLCQD